MTQESRPFDIEKVLAGNPAKMEKGNNIEIIFYLPEDKYPKVHHYGRIGILVENDTKITHFPLDGVRHDYNVGYHLVLAPFCEVEGKGVYVGDQVVVNGVKGTIDAYYSESSTIRLTVDSDHFLIVPTKNISWPKAMIKLGDKEYPEPEKTAPPGGAVYFCPSLSMEDCYLSFIWQGTSLDVRRLERNLVHFSKEDAIAHAKAWL